MLDYSLNIGGSEWMIIIFVALVLILGTGKLPGAARKMGKAVNEYNKAKNEIQNQMKEFTEESPKISGPVETEREKLEMIAKSAGVKIENKTDDELRENIAAKIGQKRPDESKKFSFKGFANYSNLSRTKKWIKYQIIFFTRIF